MIKVILLATYLLTAMTDWVPLDNHAYYEKKDDTLLRYINIALATAKTALDDKHTPVFEGDDKRVKTALLLASIASTETGYEKTAVICKRGGDHNIAWGPWQTHTDKKKTCSSLDNAADMALNFVEISFNWCAGKVSALDKLSGYTDGRCRRSWQSQRKISRALQWHKEHPYEETETDE